CGMITAQQEENQRCWARSVARGLPAQREVGAFARSTTGFWTPTTIICRSRGETALDVMRLSNRSACGPLVSSTAGPVGAGFFSGITKSGSVPPVWEFSVPFFSVLVLILFVSNEPDEAPSLLVRGSEFFSKRSSAGGGVGIPLGDCLTL